MLNLLSNILFSTVLCFAIISNQSYIQPEINTNTDSVNRSFELYQNKPDPFNDVTIIKFKINKLGQVKLDILDTHGNMIENLVDSEMDSGKFGVFFRPPQNWLSGKYSYKFESNGTSIIKEMSYFK